MAVADVLVWLIKKDAPDLNIVFMFYNKKTNKKIKICGFPMKRLIAYKASLELLLFCKSTTGGQTS